MLRVERVFRSWAPVLSESWAADYPRISALWFCLANGSGWRPSCDPDAPPLVLFGAVVSVRASGEQRTCIRVRDEERVQ